jgi:hypothetical protein
MVELYIVNTVYRGFSEKGMIFVGQKKFLVIKT